MENVINEAQKEAAGDANGNVAAAAAVEMAVGDQAAEESKDGPADTNAVMTGATP